MRMWMAPVQTLCRQHLLGEHVECHMFVGTLQKDISVAGYIRDNLFEPESLRDRHNALVAEMTRRGYNHNSPLPQYSLESLTPEQLKYRIDRQDSLEDLHRRCPECKQLYIEYQNN